jgi:ferric-dicitrate binding protein FerR (iron transport regulator)
MRDKKDKSDLTPGQEQELFSNLEFSYSRSKDDVWNALEDIIEEAPEVAGSSQEVIDESEGARLVELPASDEERSTRVTHFSRLFVGIAASVVMVLSAGLFARFYTTTVRVSAGEFASHTLPDGSEVHLNAATSISYHPYWWKMNREVSLSGEAYFVVAKGKKFTVDAVLGSTEVLGTEFNVYARSDDFVVLCEEGRVRVSSDMALGATKEVVLTKGELAVLELNQLSKQNSDESVLTKEGVIGRKEVLSWRTGRFIYNTTPLTKVLADLERYYDVDLTLSDEILKNAGDFSGAFERSIGIEQALELVCSVYNLSYKKSGERVYYISEQ